MKPLSSPLLLCQCAILLISPERIVFVCSESTEFVVNDFSTVDIYSQVVAVGNSRSGRLILLKNKRKSRPDECGRHNVTARGPERVLRMRDIIPHTLKQEGSNPKIVSFSVEGESADYNLKFGNEMQAELFVGPKTLLLTHRFQIRWARIYTHCRPAIITYDKFEFGDVGFKVLDNGDYPDIDERLNQLPHLFMRSDIQKEIGTGPPHTLYLRNKLLVEDYMIKFQSQENRATFLELFPNWINDENRTRFYYYIPFYRSRRTDQWESHDPSQSQDTSESHDPSESQDTSE